MRPRDRLIYRDNTSRQPSTSQISLKRFLKEIFEVAAREDVPSFF